MNVRGCLVWGMESMVSMGRFFQSQLFANTQLGECNGGQYHRRWDSMLSEGITKWHSMGTVISLHFPCTNLIESWQVNS